MTTNGTRNDKFLFWASFLTLVAAGMGFAITGDIMANWGKDFGFTQTDLGKIGGMGLAGFGLTIIVFSFFADSLGYGRLMIIAFLLHLSALITTLAAPFAYKTYGKEGAYWCLYLGQLLFSLANGTCEAVINPLTATLYPKNKTHWLNILHAGWPGGLVLGSLVGLICNQIGSVGWQIKWGIILVPTILYGALMLGRPFPKSEAKLSGIRLRDMMAVVGFLGMAIVCALLGLWLSNLATAAEMSPMIGWGAAIAIWIVYGAVDGFSPGHILLTFLYLIHAMVGYVELGTDRWIQDITKSVLRDPDNALYAFMWTNVLMFTLRFFAGPIVHRISPLGLLFCSAVLGTTGLLLLGLPATNTIWLWMGAVTIYGIGKTFYWPTMLGVVSERYPKGGALALGISGGIGMLSAGLLGGPLIGYKQDYAATQELEQKDMAAYQRYKSDKADAPLPGLKPIAGLNNKKIGVLNDEGAALAADVELLKKENRTDENIAAEAKWWDEAKPFAKEDKPQVNAAVTYGGKKALFWTAAVPATMAVCYLLLIIYFRSIGGYKQVHIGDEHGGVPLESTPR